MPQRSHLVVLTANILAFGLLGINYQSQQQARQALQHSIAVINTMQQLRSSVVIARSRYDAYRANPTSLPAYRDSLATVQHDIATAQALTVDNAPQQQRLAQFQTMLQFQAQAPAQLLFTDAERRQLLAITGEEVQLLAQRSSRADTHAAMLVRLTIACFLVSGLATAIAALETQRKAIALQQLALKRTELADRTRQLETILANIPAAVLIRDRAGVCLEVLSRGDNLLFEPERMLGTTPFEVAPIKVATQIVEAIAQALDTQQTVRLDYQCPLPGDRTVWFDASISPIDANRVLVIAADGTNDHVLHGKLLQLATQDALTGLFNRRFFEQMVRQEILTARQQATTKFAFLVVDVDRLKSINSQFSHLGGDAAIRAIAEVLQAKTRKGDVCARLSVGDEFGLLLQDVSLETVTMRANEIRATVAATVVKFDGQIIPVRISIGVALFPTNGHDFETLYYAAAKALKDSKDLGRDRVALAV